MWTSVVVHATIVLILLVNSLTGCAWHTRLLRAMISISAWKCLYVHWMVATCTIPDSLVLLQKPGLVDHTEMARFHSEEYVNFLRLISPDNKEDYTREMHKCTQHRVRFMDFTSRDPQQP